MRRRAFLGVLVAAAITPRALEAQTVPRRVAILGPLEEPRFSEVLRGLQDGLADNGFPERTIETLQGKVARGDSPAARSFVQHAVREDVAVLFVIGSELTRLAREISPRIPIVFITPGDPVAAGIVASLAHPGNNMTAMTFEFPELSAKRLELLREIVPRVRRVLVLYDPRDASPRQALAAARDAAPKLGLFILEREVRNEAEVTSALQSLTEADAFLAIPGGVSSAHYRAIIRAAHEKRLATMVHSRTTGAVEALASYGVSDVGVAREAARLVSKILNGENAGDLPVERPTKLQFVINLKTATALGVTVPPTVLARADEVIE